MKQITKINPDPGQKDYPVNNLADDGTYIHGVGTDYPSVDLGLPSGLLWAKCNIGATNEEEAGLYFQLGDTQGYTAEQVGDGEGLKAFSWTDYKFSIDGSSSNFSKYNESDTKTVLDLEDDAAHVIMGGNWRMPTFEECRELFENTDVYLIQTDDDDKEIHGTKVQDDENAYLLQWDENPSTETFKGIKLYKKNDKGTYLFVPVSGVAVYGSLRNVGQGGYLWSSSLYSSGVRDAWDPGFNSVAAGFDGSDRYYGLPVRGVKSNS